MTKKQFIALADTIRGCCPAEPTNASESELAAYHVAKLQWHFMRGQIANFCTSENPNFNRERWLDYIDGKCGPNGGKL